MAESSPSNKNYSEPTLELSEIHNDIAIEIQDSDSDSDSFSSTPNSDIHVCSDLHKNTEARNSRRCSGYPRNATIGACSGLSQSYNDIYSKRPQIKSPKRRRSFDDRIFTSASSALQCSYPLSDSFNNKFTYDDTSSPVNTRTTTCSDVAFRGSCADPKPLPLCIQIPFTQSDQCIKYTPMQINTNPTIATRRSRSKSFDEYSTYSTHHSQNDHKRDLYDIHRTFSVSRFHYFPPVEPSSPNNGDSRKTHHPTNPSMELCMEFFWCFWCCFKVPLCRTKLESACFPPKTDTSKPTPLYDCIYTLVFSPQYQSSTTQLTRVQKLAVLVRLSFELYKTMIGSFLTIFTPQNCNNRICSLTENLIPKDNLEIAALAMNSFMAFILLCEYAVEFAREKILRMYFLTDPRLPVEKEYFTNLLGILDVSGASLRRRFRPIEKLFWLYRQIGIILLSVYVANIIISGAVIYKNYYDKSSLFGFTTNVLFIVLKIGKILKIAIHSTKIPYSAYIESPVAFNSIKSDYICEEIKTHYFNPANAGIPSNENTDYFARNPQYTRFLLDSMLENAENV
jgi:hypothetical protein